MADDADGHRDTADGLGSIGAGQAGPDSWVCVCRERCYNINSSFNAGNLQHLEHFDGSM